MDSDTLRSIGEPSRRTDLTVKTIRFCSDTGIVPPTDRSPAGYRLCGPDALARLHLARTLRDMGLDLATVRRVPDRETDLMHRLATLCRAERHRLVSDFRATLRRAAGGAVAAGHRRSARRTHPGLREGAVR